MVTVIRTEETAVKTVIKRWADDSNQMEGRSSHEVGGGALTALGGGDGEQRRQTHPPAPALMGFKGSKPNAPALMGFTKKPLKSEGTVREWHGHIYTTECKTES